MTAVKLLQLLQARNGQSAKTVPQDGASGMEEQAVARINDTTEFFDAMLVDYAKRVHNYKDPSLEEARRPAPSEHEQEIVTLMTMQHIFYIHTLDFCSHIHPKYYISFTNDNLNVIIFFSLSQLETSRSR